MDNRDPKMAESVSGPWIKADTESLHIIKATDANVESFARSVKE